MRTSAVWAVLVVLGLATFAFGSIDVQAHDDIWLGYVTTPPPGSVDIHFPNYGGAFWAVLYDDSDRTPQGKNAWVASSHSDNTKNIENGAFYTFCLERYEYFNPPNWYDIESLPQSSVASNRAMTGYSAWVYNQFLVNVRDDIIHPRDNLEATKTLIGHYQEAIWMGMVPYTNVGGTAGRYDPGVDTLNVEPGGAGAELVGNANNADLVAAGIDLNSFYAAWSWWHDAPHATNFEKLAVVQSYGVISVQDNSGTLKQDMEMLHGEPVENITPEPASLLIWSVLGIGSAGLAWSRRRRGDSSETGSPRWNRANREAICDLIERGRKA
ncbi:MAG: PEP-CTERM sorting domain-containing protein [Planctomycetia bacterium]|nr:PEP-CTERM sorting domain-containing protein [Planctomycetia bacterium]